MHNRTGCGKNQEKRGAMRPFFSKLSVIGPIKEGEGGTLRARARMLLLIFGVKGGKRH
jgi:hypothetical protein